ncbi:MAG: DUF5372 family protein [Kiritimatiellia bacterium]
MHPFHPWCGRQFEQIDLRRRWGQWRVYFATESGCHAYLPAAWTDAGPADPFVEQSGGRAIGRTEDLLRLADLADDLSNKSVKENTPHV